MSIWVDEISDFRPIVPHWVHEIAAREDYPRSAYQCHDCDLQHSVTIDPRPADRSCGWRPSLLP